MPHVYFRVSRSCNRRGWRRWLLWKRILWIFHASLVKDLYNMSTYNMSSLFDQQRLRYIISECDPTVNYTQRDCEQYHLMYKILNKCDCYPRWAAFRLVSQLKNNKLWNRVPRTQLIVLAIWYSLYQVAINPCWAITSVTMKSLWEYPVNILATSLSMPHALQQSSITTIVMRQVPNREYSYQNNESAADI